MNQYPPYQEDPRYPNQKRPPNQQPQWGATSWDNQQGQPQTGDPQAPASGYGQYGQYASPSQQPQSGYGQYGDQGQYGQYGPPSQYGQSQQGWGYDAPAPQSQYGSYGQYGQYGPPSQQPPYGAYDQYGAPPAPYGYPAPGQQDLDYDYDDAPPRKSRRRIYTILSVFGGVLAIMVVCGVLANLPPKAPTNTASIAGTWYGRANIAADGIGTVASEAYMDLQQTGTSVTGAGKLCVNKRGSATEFVNLKIDGSMSGTNATITWHMDILTTGAKGDGQLTGTLTNGALSLIYQDGSSNITLGAKKGTRQEYLAACRQLPGS